MDWEFFETYGAAISALLGALGIRILDKMLSKRSDTIVEEARQREEARLENQALRHENRALEAEVDLWKEKYYDKVERSLFHPPSGSL